MSLISITQLGKIYPPTDAPTIALREVDLSIEKGDFLAIVGASGSGKSTLLQILGLLDDYSTGLYLLNGKETRGFSEEELARQRNEVMSFVFQSFNLLPRTSVLENVKLPLAYSQINPKEWDERAKKSLDLVGLTHRLMHEPAQLSGGEKQRVAIARALVTDPEILFADEPTGNLDSNSGMVVMETLESLHASGKTVVLITHDRNLAKRADKAIMMKDGAIFWRGEAKHIPEL